MDDVSGLLRILDLQPCQEMSTKIVKSLDELDVSCVPTNRTITLLKYVVNCNAL